MLTRFKSENDDIILLTKELSFIADKIKIPIILGVDQKNQVVVGDFSDIGNILIGGETGSGKSIFFHSLICSLIQLFTSKECKLLLIDTKRVDLTSYDTVPHLYHTVLTEPADALSSLQSIVNETDRRLKNNINQPYLFVIIDTFSDVASVNPQLFFERLKTVTANSCKTNVYVLMADSRISPDLYTKELLSMFKTKICFKTSDHIGSKILLGNGDATKLLKPGEMIIKISESITEMLKGIDTSEDIVKYCLAKIKVSQTKENRGG